MKDSRATLYIDDAGWGPEAGSIEYRYRVPFGGIRVFIGKIGEPGPELDICTDLVEMAQRARPTRAQPAMKRALWDASTEGNFLKDLNMVVRRPSSLTVIRPPVQQICCIKCKMACVGAVPMAVVFRTPLSR